MSRKVRSKSTNKQNKSAPDTNKENDQFGLERLVFFSDAVFAIAITLLSIDIRLPDTDVALTNAQLWYELLEIWPKYLAYVISFMVIGLFWINHHRRYRFIRSYDRRLIFLNLVLLMAIAFVPFPTSVLSDYGNRTATIFYALVMILINSISALIWWYASHDNRLIDPNMSREEKRHQMMVPLLVIAVFALSIGLAFIDDDLAKYALLLLLFTHSLSRRL